MVKNHFESSRIRIIIIFIRIIFYLCDVKPNRWVRKTSCTVVFLWHQLSGLRTRSQCNWTSLGWTGELSAFRSRDITEPDEMFLHRIWIAVKRSFVFVTCKIEDFSKYIGQKILLVCLSVCQSPTGHNLKTIFTELHQAVEVFSTEKPIDLRSKVILRSNF